MSDRFRADDPLAEVSTVVAPEQAAAARLAVLGAPVREAHA